MKTGLTKRQKTTCIYFDEASKTVEIQTHNTFEIDRRRFAVRLTAPYSNERRQAASELAKKNGLKGRV